MTYTPLIWVYLYGTTISLYRPSLFLFKTHFDSIKHLVGIILLLLDFFYILLFIISLNSFMIDNRQHFCYSGYSLFHASCKVFSLPYADFITLNYACSWCIRYITSGFSSSVISFFLSFM